MHPTLFHIGPMPIRSFGLLVLTGFGLALWYAMSEARRRLLERSGAPDDRSRPPARNPRAQGSAAERAAAERAAAEGGTAGLAAITPDHVFDMSLGALFVAIVGARVLFVLLDLNSFRNNWWEVFQVWSGGISVHGAIVSGAIYLWWYCRRHRLRFLEFGDLCAPAFALGYAVGRIGCFLNGCCYGYACSLPWASRFLTNERTGILTPPSHPTQLYATAMNLAIFGILHFWNRREHRAGEVLLGYFALYCVYRFIDEHFRKGATAEVFVLGLTHAQVFSLAALPVILLLLARLRRGPRPMADPAPTA